MPGVHRSGGALVIALFLLSCGPPLEPVAEPFIALQRDFRGFTTWSATKAMGQPTNGHVSGPHTVYVNEHARSSREVFNLGSIIVKVMDEAPEGDDPIVAMAKRGGGFNNDGAPGWEWFGLAPGADGPVIVWRGAGPPNEHRYGRSKSVCNDCHAAAQDNDYVHSRAAVELH